MMRSFSRRWMNQRFRHRELFPSKTREEISTATLVFVVPQKLVGSPFDEIGLRSCV
jgi:hypothetical protein